jgi:hypothetical protein
MTKPESINPTELGFFTEQAEKVLSIDPTVNLADSRVYIFSGTLDATVVPVRASVFMDWTVRSVVALERHFPVGSYVSVCTEAIASVADIHGGGWGRRRRPTTRHAG